jgi:hypothetical protein
MLAPKLSAAERIVTMGKSVPWLIRMPSQTDRAALFRLRTRQACCAVGQWAWGKVTRAALSCNHFCLRIIALVQASYVGRVDAG